MLTSLGVYDFQKWLNDLGVSATGIAIKEDRPTFPWQHETIRSLQGIQASCFSLAISGLECRSRTGRQSAMCGSILSGLLILMFSTTRHNYLIRVLLHGQLVVPTRRARA